MRGVVVRNQKRWVVLRWFCVLTKMLQPDNKEPCNQFLKAGFLLVQPRISQVPFVYEEILRRVELSSQRRLHNRLQSQGPPPPTKATLHTTFFHFHHHHQWRYSPGRALASLMGFVMVRYITMWVISPTIHLF
jgi:hypothetical protein